MDLRTCRFCGMSNYEHDHPMRHSAWVKYGPRHSAHLTCLHRAKGDAAILNLPSHILKALPALEVQSLGLLDALKIISKTWEAQ